MLAGAKLIAFAAISDADRARQFYCGLLGLDLREETEFALVLDAAGVELRLQKVGEVLAPPYTSLGWQVDAIDETVAALAASGIAFEKFPFLEQDANNIWASPSGARIAWFRDPDGNLLSLTQPADAPQ